MGAEQSNLKPAAPEANTVVKEGIKDDACIQPSKLSDEESELASTLIENVGEDIKKAVDESLEGGSDDSRKAELARERVSTIARNNNAAMQILAAQHPARFNTIITHVIAGLVFGPIATGILSILGFTGAGIAAGSLAAEWQASIGNVAAGSVFAFLQGTCASGVIMGLGFVIGTPIAIISLGIRGIIGWWKWLFGK